MLVFWSPGTRTRRGVAFALLTELTLLGPPPHRVAGAGGCPVAVYLVTSLLSGGPDVFALAGAAHRGRFRDSRHACGAGGERLVTFLQRQSTASPEPSTDERP